MCGLRYGKVEERLRREMLGCGGRSPHHQGWPTRSRDASERGRPSVPVGDEGRLPDMLLRRHALDPLAMVGGLATVVKVFEVPRAKTHHHLERLERRPPVSRSSGVRDLSRRSCATTHCLFEGIRPDGGRTSRSLSPRCPSSMTEPMKRTSSHRGSLPASLPPARERRRP